MNQDLNAGALSWPKVTALGVAIAISGNFVGWNYGLGVGGWGGMTTAAVAMVVLFWCLTQCLAELAAAMPEGGGFDHYVRRALGPGAGFIAGMAVAIALAVGAGLGLSFAQGYTESMFGLGGWWLKVSLLVAVVGLQLRGAHEAGGITLAIGALIVLVLVVLLLYLAPQFDAANLRSVVNLAAPTLLPGGWKGAAACIPFALFLFLGVEQAAHAATEMRDMARNISKAMGTSIAVAGILGLSVLLIVTGSAGADHLAGVADPLFAAVMVHGQASWANGIARFVGTGALVAIMGTFFSLAYAGSRQFYHLAQAGCLPAVFHHTNQRRAPDAALLLLAAIAIVTAGFKADDAMVVFIFLISVSHFFVLLTFIRLRTTAPAMSRPYRAKGGVAVAAIATLLSLAVMVSCYQLQVRALSIAIAGLVLLWLFFVIRKPGDTRGA
ncbi:MAG: amino acid permease [Steroidobacteraceae bacterium]